MTFDLVGRRHWFFIGSGVLVVLALIVLAIPPALRPGIEFTSGTTTQIRFDRNAPENELRAVYASLGHPEVRIQSVAGGRTYLIRTSELQVPEGSFTEIAPEPTAAAAPPGPAALEPIGSITLGAEGESGEVLLRSAFRGDPCDFFTITGRVPAGTTAQVIRVVDSCDGGERTVYEVASGAALGFVDEAHARDFVAAGTPDGDGEATPDRGERTVIENALRERFGSFEVLEFASVSAVVSTVAVRNATVAMIVATFFILGYVAWAFSSVPRPFRYGASAIVALIHDVIIVVGAFSLLGKFAGTEINLMFVTGLLTVVGFSVHDTIVVFDRIRENVTVAPNAPFEDNVNAALVQTLSRSLNTSLTVLITVGAMLLLGGVTIRDFLLVILIGVISGTYSSIAIASQVLVAWEKGDVRRWLRRVRTPETSTAG